MDTQVPQTPQAPVVPNQQSMQEVPVIAPESKRQGNRLLLMAVIFIVVALVIIGSGFLWRMISSEMNTAQTATPSVPVSGKDQAKTIDLSPSVPNSQKTIILIELSDSSFEKVIMESSLAAGYIKALPQGDRVISQTPAGQ